MPDNTTSNPTAPGDLPIAALLRMAADGETLTPDQQSLVEAYCQENADKPCCMKFEQALRKHVGTVLGDAPAAPEALCAEVRKLASTHADAQEAPEPIVRSSVAFWLQQRWVPMAMAAALVLAISATFVFQSTNVFNPSMPSWIETTQQASLVSFLDREHQRVSTNQRAADAKFTADTPQDAAELIQTRLGLTPCQLNLFEDCQLKLVGAGGCGVPGDGKSVHALYTDPTTQQTLSVFIQQDPNETQLDPALLCATRLSEGNEVLAWRFEGLIYFVVCSDKAQADAVMASLGAPDARSNL